MIYDPGGDPDPIYEHEMPPFDPQVIEDDPWDVAIELTGGPQCCPDHDLYRDYCPVCRLFALSAATGADFPPEAA
jgi:hypothetical protein